MEQESLREGETAAADDGGGGAGVLLKGDVTCIGKNVPVGPLGLDAAASC